jgi:hypothetical protein
VKTLTAPSLFFSKTSFRWLPLTHKPQSARKGRGTGRIGVALMLTMLRVVIFPRPKIFPMTTYSRQVAAHIAKAIVNGAHGNKKFSSLHSEALGAIQMSTPTSSTGMNASSSSPVKVAIGRPATVTDLGRKAEAPNADTNNDHITPVSSQVGTPMARPVDFKSLAGSYPGDHRAQGAPAVLPANPGPREPKGQSHVMSSKLHDAPGPQVTVSGETTPSSEVE